jgi:ComF family protein
VSVLLPAPCRICGATLTDANRIPICAACFASIEPIVDPMCSCCGRPFELAPQVEKAPGVCRLCRANFYAFERARSFAYYNDALAGAIVLLQYEEVTRLGHWFAERLAEVIRNAGQEFQADAVVPVPLHPDRQRERGYNQAELIARPLARRLGLKLGASQHWKSVRGAYATRQGVRVDKLRILLVDDVLTTGATLDACSRVLKKAEAASWG